MNGQTMIGVMNVLAMVMTIIPMKTVNWFADVMSAYTTQGTMMNGIADEVIKE